MENFFDDLMLHLKEYYQQAIEVVPKLAMAIVLLFLFIWLSSILANGFKKRIGSRMDDPLLVQFLAIVIRYSIIAIAILIGLKIIGLGGIATSIMAGAGVGAFVIGFAFKDIGENFLAGIMMAFNRPFRLNDTVELNGLVGKVVALNLRDTQLKTFDGKDVFIPNGAIVKNPVINYTIDGFIRSDFSIGLDYDTNIPEAINLIKSTLENIDALEKDDRSSNVVVEALSTNAVNLRIYYWLDTFHPKMSSSELKNLIFDKVITSMKQANINMPANIVEIKNYNSTPIQLKTTSN